MTAQAFIRAGDVECSEPLHYKECGLENIYLRSGFEIVPRGSGTFLRIKDREGLHRAIAQHLVCNRKTFTGKEIRFIRIQMDLTQRDLADKIGTTSQSVARWEKDQTAIPGAADRMLRILFSLSLLSASEFQELVKELSDKIEQMGGVIDRPAVFDHADFWSEQREAA